MAPVDVTEALARGGESLAEGDWDAARSAFETALEGASSRLENGEAEEGLGRASWWRHDFDRAVTHFERAYAAFRAAGDRHRAARAALWLAREYAAAFGNHAASSGWHARAEGLLDGSADAAGLGWLAVARAERASEPREILPHAVAALQVARQVDDPDLEAAALARVGYAEVAVGEVEAGLAKVDEAMAAATGGEVASLETVGDVICVGIAACEHAADWQRIEQWGQVVERWLEQHEHVAVLGFCYACCAEMFVASGQWETAEGLLAEGLGEMQRANLRARCVHPAAKLAELRLLQGRIEEAEQLLAGFEELPEATHALAMLHLARGDVAIAAAVLHRRLNAVGEDNVLAAPFLALLVDVRLAQGDVGGAEETTRRLEAVADRSALPRITAMARFVRGRVAAAAGQPEAVGHLEAAMAAFAAQGLSLDAARARFELARTVSDPDVAVGEARTALAEFERLGAPREADAAAAFLRDRGVAGRTGPKNLGILSQREVEVLALLGEGLTNAEIAARLYISTKTAGNHVGNVLSKLHLRSRSEAAAFAVRHLVGSPDPK
ncbi:MAG TPA: LuxR C-terminal-related transcriptional regulator [Actinomycetota bacterium]|nr:LuxR C-terminal-related transcriptional regulator [Actinomycetota bacterium]